MRLDADTAAGTERPTGPLSGTVGRLRRPEYTGANRCLPCTAVNLLVAGVAGVGVGVASAGLGLTSGPTAPALATFGAAAAVVYLRGYLVPGTPQLTRRYLPDQVLRWFDTHGHGGQLGGETDVEALLVEFDVVTDCASGEDLCLRPSFAEAWWDRIDDVREQNVTGANLAALLGSDAAGTTVVERGQGTAHVVTLGGEPVGRWESRAAFLADVSAAGQLAGHPAWTRLTVEQRGATLNGLRLFLERCPACDGPVTLGEDVVESCCRSFDVVAVTCDECGSRLFEVEARPDARRA